MLCGGKSQNRDLCFIRSTSNPQDKGACNSVHYQYYEQNSNMMSSVTMYIIGYIIFLHNTDTLNGLLSCVKVSALEDRRKWKVKVGAVKQSNFV